MKRKLANLNKYYLLWSIIECGSSVTRAAAMLKVSPSTISESIQGLEDILECDLFIRKHKSIEPTNFGLWLYGQLNPGMRELHKLTHDGCKILVERYQQDIGTKERIA